MAKHVDRSVHQSNKRSGPETSNVAMTKKTEDKKFILDL
jgi:hypothetical protein